MLSRYSEKNKADKDSTFPAVKKKALKKAGFKGNFKYKEAVCFTGYSL